MIPKLSTSSFPWIALASFRRSHNVTQTNELLSSPLASQLWTFTRPSVVGEDDRLWKTIGGVRGLMEMYRDAGTMITTSRRLRKNGNKFHTLAIQDLYWGSRYLKVLLWFCLAECALVALKHAMPRICARSCTWLYCDAHSTLTALVEFCDSEATTTI